MCGSSSSWCARADALFNVIGMHVIDVVHEGGWLAITVETDQDVGGCPSCGTVAIGHGRRVHALADAPCFGTPVRLRWVKRIWRCPEPACAVTTFSEQHDLAPPRAKLTSRAVSWATDALAQDDTTVSALYRHLGVDWHTVWDAVEAEAVQRVNDPARLTGVSVLGGDEHVWRPSRIGDPQRAVTGIVDLTRDDQGNLHARLLHVVPGRSGTAYAGWLREQDGGFIAGIEQASLDPTPLCSSSGQRDG
jgi:transposase